MNERVRILHKECVSTKVSESGFVCVCVIARPFMGRPLSPIEEESGQKRMLHEGTTMLVVLGAYFFFAVFVSVCMCMCICCGEAEAKQLRNERGVLTRLFHILLWTINQAPQVEIV